MKVVLGIDLGTSGFRAVIVSLLGRVLFSVKSRAPEMMKEGFEDGVRKQRPLEWLDIVKEMMAELWRQAQSTPDGDKYEVIGIGMDGQMHGLVIIYKDGTVEEWSELWCHKGKNKREAAELQNAWGISVPERLTLARFLQWIRRNPDKAKEIDFITTPAGYVFYRCTGVKGLGIGEAAGVGLLSDDCTGFSKKGMDAFDALSGSGMHVMDLLPMVKGAGATMPLKQFGAELLGVPCGKPCGFPEGDQPASRPGAFAFQSGQVTFGTGTSTCANIGMNAPFNMPVDGLGAFRDPAGLPFAMVWRQNGAVVVKKVVQDISGAENDTDTAGAFRKYVPIAMDGPIDCGGLLCLPFADQEPDMDIEKGMGQPKWVYRTDSNFHAANRINAAALGMIFSVRVGFEQAISLGVPIDEVIVTGGLTRSHWHFGPLIANGLGLPVRVHPEVAEAGSPYGAALQILYALPDGNPSQKPWSDFLQSIRDQLASVLYTPGHADRLVYNSMYHRFHGAWAAVRT